MASSRVIEGSVPVRTKVFPASGNSAAFFAETFRSSVEFQVRFSRCKIFLPVADAKKSRTLCATTWPNFGDDAALFVGLAFRSLRKTGFNQPLGDFCLRSVSFRVSRGNPERRGAAAELATPSMAVVETEQAVVARGLPDIRNGESKSQREAAKFCARSIAWIALVAFFSPKIARRFIRAEIQFGELLGLELEQIERFAHEPALDQFVRHNAAVRFRCRARRAPRKFHAPRCLRRTLKIFAAPGDELADRAGSDRRTTGHLP